MHFSERRMRGRKAGEPGNMKNARQCAASGVSCVKRSLPMRGIAANAVKLNLNYVMLYVNRISNRARIMEQPCYRISGSSLIFSINFSEALENI